MANGKLGLLSAAKHGKIELSSTQENTVTQRNTETQTHLTDVPVVCVVLSCVRE